MRGHLSKEWLFEDENVTGYLTDGIRKSQMPKTGTLRVLLSPKPARQAGRNHESGVK
jgi:hypothetical protein